MARLRRGHVVVVGAGAAGLTAARALIRAGLRATVIEARDRVGGRVDTRLDSRFGVPIEYGAEFVHGRPQGVLALSREAGVAVRRVPERHLVRGAERRGRELEQAHEILALGGRDDEPFARLLSRPEVRRRFAPGALALAAGFVEGFYLADPRRASSLALARMEQAMDSIGGDRAYRVQGGWGAVLSPLVRALSAKHAELRLSTTVEELRWRPGAVEVRARGAAGGILSPIRAERAVVTLPVGVLKSGAVRFSPALFGKRRALAALESGPVVKAVMRFRRPFWERRGAPALSFLHTPRAPFPVLWSLSPVRAPILVAWAGGPSAARLTGRPRVAAPRGAVAALARGLGLSAGEVEDELDALSIADWTADPLARGGYAVFPVGSAFASRALAEPVAGTLFFAGEATAGLADAGTVEGAIRSGERAAREVVESLG